MIWIGRKTPFCCYDLVYPVSKCALKIDVADSNKCICAHQRAIRTLGSGKGNSNVYKRTTFFVSGNSN